MNGDQPISWLMFFTLAAGVVIVGLAFINFIRSRSNRAIAADTLEGNGSGRGAAPDGALPELLGLGAFALIAMGLLAAGANYSSNRETVQVSGPASGGTTTGQSGGTTTGQAQSGRPVPAERPNPASDLRWAPTASSTGVGSSTGTTGTPVTK
jgi:hypothetical protein